MGTPHRVGSGPPSLFFLSFLPLFFLFIFVTRTGIRSKSATWVTAVESSNPSTGRNLPQGGLRNFFPQCVPGSPPPPFSAPLWLVPRRPSPSSFFVAGIRVRWCRSSRAAGASRVGSCVTLLSLSRWGNLFGGSPAVGLCPAPIVCVPLLPLRRWRHFTRYLCKKQLREFAVLTHFPCPKISLPFSFSTSTLPTEST